MATVNFLYRSNKPKSNLNLRLLYREGNVDYVLGGKTRLEVTREYWDKYHGMQRVKDIQVKNKQTEVNNELSNIENYVLDKFNSTAPGLINKEWLKNVLDSYYNPKERKGIPSDLIGYIDYYLEQRANEITEGGVKRIKVTKHKMERLQKALKEPILIKNINEDFKKAYVDFCNSHNYSKNTQQRELVLIKTICFHAKYSGLKTHHQLESLKLQREEVKHIYLNPDELEKIKSVKLAQDYLENARDWLIISCYTGQRISDFMRFKPEMIRSEDGKPLLEFKQKKTKKLMTIPLLKEVREVLDKREGNFPRPISEQRYNEYIKQVCNLAGLNDMFTGKKRQCIAPDGVKPTRNDYRDIIETCEKWEFVTSHIGRRSFATNYYGKVPTTYLINITGHGSEKMFLNYIKKSNKDLALDAHKYFE